MPVHRSAFTPPPKVMSAVVHITPAPAPEGVTFRTLERLTAAAFGQRRKMLRQSLKKLGGEALLERAGVNPTSRAEELDIRQFAALARALSA
jgi:16S rRNA (adenine1518-N6/adenine1519-N6)-dimethyltransferase